MSGSDGLDPHYGDNLMPFRLRAAAGFGQGPISRLFFAYISGEPTAFARASCALVPEAGLTTADGRACSRRLEQELS